MRLFVSVALLLWFYGSIRVLAANSTGLTDLVQWDKYSLIVNNERVFVVSGEFHYQRLPVPELWLDIFQKFKANGMNAVSIYFFWYYHSPSPEVYDYETAGKDVQRVLDYAQEAGLYVLTRPGPYCNAETNAGGIALWGSDGSAGKLRTSDETYHQAWLPWIKSLGIILERNQITHGGPVILNQIENELQETDHSPNNTLVLYMEQIEQAWRDAGIVVPFFSNEKGMRSESWSTDYEDVGGAVNIYGLDSYPGGLSCLQPDTGFDVVRTYYQWFQNYSFTQPEFIPEYAGGYFEPWGGPFFDQCVGTYLAPEYADVFYKTLLGQRVTLFNLYMTYGGTNWGHSGAPVVYTSYDYDAPLRETREIRDKFRQTKLIGLFTRVSKGLLKTYMESNGSGNAVDTAAVYTFVLRNPDTRAGFYFADHNDSSTRGTTAFGITLNTTAGVVTVPKVELQGRQSRIIVSDYPVGSATLLYSSAEVLTYGIFGKETVLVFYLNEGETGEFAFKSSRGLLTYKTYSSDASFSGHKTSNETFTRYTYVQPSGQSVITFSNGVTAYLLEKATAYNFFAPSTDSDPNGQPDKQIFVIGPYLVRSASVSGNVVTIVGDNQNDTTIEVYAGSGVNTIAWNGKHLSTKKTAYGSLTASTFGAQDRSVSFPELQWKVADSLPEKQRSYHDSKWTTANKTSTLSPVKPLTLPVLFSSDYGYYSGIKLYRGRFDGKTATSANVTVQGGIAAGWSAWLNGDFVGGYVGNATVNANWMLLEFCNATLFDTDNVLTVVTDYHGHDETSTGPAGAENPRGILGASLYAGNNTLNFTSWKIQGQAGGDQAYIDPVRGSVNEGGLYGERLGWHLPGFDASEWKAGSPMDGVTGAGVNWYIADAPLDIDTDLDVPVGIEFSSANGTMASVQLFVNGYQYGKYLPQIGPQTRFPIPPGIINLNGKNRIAVSLWSMSGQGAKLDSVKLFAYGQYTTGYAIPRDGSKIGLQPGWTESRLQYT